MLLMAIKWSMGQSHVEDEFLALVCDTLDQYLAVGIDALHGFHQGQHIPAPYIFLHLLDILG